jgi:energy-coupling factor transport system ATP-binding protein
MSIKIQNLSHIYMPGTGYEQKALEKISFEFSRGEFIGLAGHTGSGKSTLIQHILGLLKPSEGQIFVDDVDIHKNSESMLLARKKIGMVFQYPEYQLFEETVELDIAFGPKNQGLDEETITKRVKKAMKFVGLDYDLYRDKSPFHLSGGQMRRVAIAGILALEPEFLILDEPTAGLDPRGRREILTEIEKLYLETGIGVLFISHNMDDLVQYSNRIVVLNKGKVFLDGRPEEIFIEKADLLPEAGLRVPALNELVKKLKEKEFLGLSSKLYDIENLADEIAKSVRS